MPGKKGDHPDGFAEKATTICSYPARDKMSEHGQAGWRSDSDAAHCAGAEQSIVINRTVDALMNNRLHEDSTGC